VQSAVGKLMDRWHHQDARFSVYKLTGMEDCTAHDLIVRATDGLVTPQTGSARSVWRILPLHNRD